MHQGQDHEIRPQWREFSAKMEGVVELAEEIFHMPVSIGKPRCFSGLADIVRNPIYATAVGLLQYGSSQAPGLGRIKSKIDSESLLGRVKQWFMGN